MARSVDRRLPQPPVIIDVKAVPVEGVEPLVDIIDERDSKNGTQALAVLRAASANGKMAHIEPDDVHDLARAYPPENIPDDKPVTEDAILVASAMVELFKNDPEAYKVALTTAAKKACYERDIGLFDQKAAGLTAAALATTAGVSHGTLPARMIYRIRPATFGERLRYWGRDKWSPSLIPRWLRRGPDEVGEDVSLWFIARSCWHLMRVDKSGIPQTVARPELPCDMAPEHTLGDDWKVIERIPLLRSQKTRGFSMIRTEIDMLAAAMGYRTRFGGLILPEFLNMILDTRAAGRRVEHKRKKTKQVTADGSIENAERGGFASAMIGLVKVVGMVGLIVSLAWAAITFGGRV